MKQKLAIIGASYLQLPLIKKAKKLGVETHVFAWKANDIGEKEADFFYPISIIEKEKILERCKCIKIDGICSIASDLANITVNYVAMAMNLTGNTLQSSYISTNKYAMRKAFLMNGDPSPKSFLVLSEDNVSEIHVDYPIIVKPTDRSGSRGITKLQSESGLRKAIKDAIQEGFEKKALVEEYVAGQEYSVESISWEGKHTFLAITKKFTTGSPHFIETGHEQPVQLKKKKIDQVKNIVFHALDTLQIKYGASHSELKISNDGRISLIEIGARMGGDCIGSSLVEISTGVEFVADVIKIALGEKPEIHFANKPKAAAIRYILSQEDMKVYKQVKQEHPEYIVEENIEKDVSGEVKDSSGRYGYFILSADDVGCLDSYMPVEVEDKDKGTSCGKSKAYR